MWEKIVGLVVAFAVVLLTLKLLFLIAAKDREITGYSLKITCRVGLLVCISSELVYWCGSCCFFVSEAYDCNTFICNTFIISGFWGNLGKLTIYIALGVLAGCLLMACVTDCQNCMVYHFVWWIGGIAGTILLIISCQQFYYINSISIEKFVLSMLWRLFPVLLFGLLQEKIFSRMYGKADCHAFVVCAVAECAAGLAMKEYLTHMLLAIALLAAVQGYKRNIGRNGNLKKGVPFLPYITISFWTILLAN